MATYRNVCKVASAVTCWLVGCGSIAQQNAVPGTVTQQAVLPLAIGAVTTVAGSGLAGARDDTVDVATFNYPYGLAKGTDGRLLVSEYDNHDIRVAFGNRVSTLAGSPSTLGNRDGVGAAALFAQPRDAVLDAEGNFYVSDVGPNAPCTIRKVDPTGNTTTVAPLCGPFVLDAGGGFVVADGARLVRIDAMGTQTILAGDVAGGYGDGQGAAAKFGHVGISSLGRDADGNIYAADPGNQRIRKISPSAMVTTFAGSGQVGASDSDSALQASFNEPVAVTVNVDGYVYVADELNYAIRRVSPDGVVTTVVGGSPGPGWLDAIGKDARINAVAGLSVDAQGDLYLADSGNNRIRKVAMAGSGKLVVHWQAPSAAPAVTSYTVTASASGRTDRTCVTADTTCTLHGLTSGVSYGVVITATNSIGTGPASAPVYGTPN